MVKVFRCSTLLLFLTLGALFVSCDEVNSDAQTETRCTAAVGLWTMRTVTCDGVGVEVAPSTFSFDPDSNLVTQTLGRVDCTKTYNWDVEISEETPLFSMIGQGTISCTQSGMEVSSCSSDVNRCNSGIDFTGIKNEYPTCVITENGLSLTREVSGVNNPDGLSFCENGEIEKVNLVQGSFIPPAPEPEPEEGTAFLEVDGTNPLDYGTHPVGSRIVQRLKVTNIGGAEAQNITGTGIAAPFYFVGGAYPGVGGTCGTGPLEIGAFCEIIIEFFPLSADYFSDTLLLSFGNGNGTVTISQGLAATASQSLALLTINGGPYVDFGPVSIGQTPTQLLTVTNGGGGSASLIEAGPGLEAPYRFSGGAFPGDGGDCTNTLPAGDNCQIEIEFAPSVQGNFNDVIEVNYSDGINSQTATRNVFGEGVP